MGVVPVYSVCNVCARLYEASNVCESPFAESASDTTCSCWQGGYPFDVVGDEGGEIKVLFVPSEND